MKHENEKDRDYKTNDNLVIGRNAVTELLKSDREVENVLIAKGEHEGSIKKKAKLRSSLCVTKLRTATTSVQSSEQPKLAVHTE